jgi:hypothetical protein
MVQFQRTRRKKVGVPAEKSKFDATTLLEIAKDLQSGKLPLERVRISDDMCVGLRAVVNRSGLVTLHVSYEVGDDRPFWKLGDVNKDSPDYISIEDARELAKTVKALGDRGINIEDASRKRLLKELKRDGASWRPK